jgi:hypothetical protein
MHFARYNRCDDEAIEDGSDLLDREFAPALEPPGKHLDHTRHTDHDS